MYRARESGPRAWGASTPSKPPPIAPSRYSRLIDFVYHSTLGLRVKEEENKKARR